MKAVASAPAQPFLVTAHPGSTTLSPHRELVVGYDLEGRPLHWFDGGETFKRSLASEVVGRRTVDGVRRRWRLPGEAALERFEQALGVARRARNELGAGATVRGPGRDELGARLERILRWTPEALLAERERFLGVYRPISILPPDQYHSVVLQASFGCSWNRCTFCTFYQGRPFSIRPEADFEAHVGSVRRFLGTAAAARTSIFLADGNALVLANSRLRPIFRAARAAFPRLM